MKHKLSKVTGDNLLNMVGELLDGNFNSYGHYLINDVKINFSRNDNRLSRNAYMKAYMARYRDETNPKKILIYHKRKAEGMCPRCNKPNDSKFFSCNSCMTTKRAEVRSRKAKQEGG